MQERKNIENNKKQSTLDLSSMTREQAFDAIENFYRPASYFEILKDKKQNMDFEHLVWDIASTIISNIENEESKYKQQDPALGMHMYTVLDRLGIKKPED